MKSGQRKKSKPGREQRARNKQQKKKTGRPHGKELPPFISLPPLSLVPTNLSLSSLTLRRIAHRRPPPESEVERRGAAAGEAGRQHVRPGGPHGPASAAVRGWPSASGRVRAGLTDWLWFPSQLLLVVLQSSLLDWIRFGLGGTSDGYVRARAGSLPSWPKCGAWCGARRILHQRTVAVALAPVNGSSWWCGGVRRATGRSIVSCCGICWLLDMHSFLFRSKKKLIFGLMYALSRSS